jgi:hypothetical protein
LDLKLFARVFWRFRYLMAAGGVLAVVQSVLTIAKPDLSHGYPSLALRSAPVYSSSSTLLLTQPGFPWGSAIQQYAPTGVGKTTTPAGDLGRLTALANLYVQLVNSDILKERVLVRDPSARTISATQNYSVSPSFYSSPLPIMTLSGYSSTPARARQATEAGVAVLTDYLTQQQTAAGIPDAQRVVLEEIQLPRKTTIVNPTKKTLPAVVFLTIMAAVVALAFVLENLRPSGAMPVRGSREAGSRVGSRRRAKRPEPHVASGQRRGQSSA